MISFIIAILFYSILAGLARSTVDIVSAQYSQSIFTKLPKKWQQFTDPSISWKNKQTSFWLTTQILSTVLVWATDLWHLAKAVMTLAIGMAFWMAGWMHIDMGWGWKEAVLLFVAVFAIKGLTHEIFRQTLLLKRPKADPAARLGDELLARYNAWFGWGATIAKSIGTMAVAFIALLGQLWIFRLIDGSYASIHAYPDSLQWPEWVIVIEFFAAFSIALGSWIWQLIKESRGKKKAQA